MSRDEIVAAARLWLGTPYRHQAARLGAGCDCLGLVRGVWQMLYGTLPAALPNYRADWRDTRHAGELLALAERLLARAEGAPQPGQVLLFHLGRTALPKHCGIAAGDGRFIHAQEGLGVIEVNLSEGWRRRLAGLHEFPGTP